jgi:hypothetical protein
MLPDDISLHDAGISVIERHGRDIVLHVDHVRVPRAGGTPLVPADDCDMATGTVTIVGVRSVIVNDEPADGIVMAGDDCEILYLDWKGHGRVEAFIIWCRYNPRSVDNVHYRIECDDLVWAQTGLMPPES